MICTYCFLKFVIVWLTKGWTKSELKWIKGLLWARQILCWNVANPVCCILLYTVNIGKNKQYPRFTSNKFSADFEICSHFDTCIHGTDLGEGPIGPTPSSFVGIFETFFPKFPDPPWVFCHVFYNVVMWGPCCWQFYIQNWFGYPIEIKVSYLIGMCVILQPFLWKIIDSNLLWCFNSQEWLQSFSRVIIPWHLSVVWSIYSFLFVIPDV